MLSLTQSDLEALENQVNHAVTSGDESALKIIGYGEITTVLLLNTPDGAFAVKRLPVMKSRQAAEHVAETIQQYTDALAAKGVNIVPNEARILERDQNTFVVYCVQTALDENDLAINWCRAHTPEQSLALFERIVDTLKNCVSPEVAPDGQLSNWALVNDELLYLDVSTPFMRHENGKSILDWRNYMGPIPAPLRPYYLHEIPKVLNKYFTIRGQMLDLLGNLRKEELDHLVTEFTAYANEKFNFETPITRDEIVRYYNEDAKMYALVERLRKADRWFQNKILRRTYPYLLAPNVKRNLY